MQSSKWFPLTLRFLLVLSAVGGWAAFAGAQFRLAKIERQLASAAEALAVSDRQCAELGANFEQLLHSQEGLQRLQQIKMKELEKKVEHYELRLRQLGISD